MVPWGAVISRDVVIIGSGPAGTSTALHLLQREPALTGEILLLDKAVHPREKVCAGGLIPHTLDCLHELEIPLSVPHVQVNRALVRVPSGQEVLCEDGGMCSVIRRDEFDASLVRTARDRGAELREGEKVLELRREGNGIRVVTEKDTYLARIVVGADGSGSRVRRTLVSEDPFAIGKAIMCDVPLADTTWDGFSQQRYDFNFLPVQCGLKGYLWEFPCLIHGEPHMNVGIYSLGGSQLTNADLQWMLTEEISSFTFQAPRSSLADPTAHILHPHSQPSAFPRKFRAFPICGYLPQRPLAAPHVVLVGDAAGAEPLMGEGISFALEYGKFAAQSILQALREQRYDFGNYTENLAQSWLGKKLARLHFTSHLFYGRTARVWFALAARSRRLQSIGLKWYNGIGGWHQRSGWEALYAVLFPQRVR
ncbi:MAG: FAD-dependent monooxygenase [Candidatus Binatia bacterium]